MKKLIVLVILLAMSVTVFTGCAQTGAASSDATDTYVSQTDAVPSDEADTYVFGYNSATITYPFPYEFCENIKTICAEEGINAIVSANQEDVTDQISSTENFITQGANALGGIFMDPEGVKPVIEIAKEAGNLPVVAALGGIAGGDEYENYIFVGTENYDGGRLLGDWLAEALPEGAKIWYLYGPTGDAQAKARYDGLVDALNAAGRDDIEIVSKIDEAWSKDVGVTVMEDWMQSYDKIDCVVGYNDDGVLGAIEAAKAAGRLGDGTIFTGFDGIDAALESIAAGELSVTVFQDPYLLAQEYVGVIKQLRDGVPASEIEDRYAPFTLVTKDNVHEIMD